MNDAAVGEVTDLQAGTMVRVRQRTYLIENVRAKEGLAPVVHLACIDDDAHGQRLSAIWPEEIDAKLIPPASESKYAINTRITRAVRDAAKRFEHRLLLSATPHNGHSNSFASLMEIGKDYYEFRIALMVKSNEGLTKTYNRFHDPDERAADIVKLRDLHAQMDRAVLDTYGWTDIQPIYDFPEQLTWGEDTRDEVLARLLEPNRVRAEEEAKQAPATPKKAAARKPKKSAKTDEATDDLFSHAGVSALSMPRNDQEKP